MDKISPGAAFVRYSQSTVRLNSEFRFLRYIHVKLHTLHVMLCDLFLPYYRKIPKISPWAYIFQRPFLRGLLLEGLLFGEVYVLREICV